jgi:hypothetical protein
MLLKFRSEVMKMSLFRFLFLLQLTTPFALGQVVGNSKPTSLPDEPKALVGSFYQKVVALHPLGDSVGGQLKVFAPYLSKALLHRIDLANACDADWRRQNRDPGAKPPGLEGGLFTGDDERAEPTAFPLERVQTENDGSIRVYVKLIRSDPDESPWTWNVAAILVRENDHLVVDDVIWLKDNPQDVEVRLSEYLSQDCDGPHWVGSKKPEGDQKHQK